MGGEDVLSLFYEMLCCRPSHAGALAVRGWQLSSPAHISSYSINKVIVID
jgi:hypothetical protein